MKKTYLFIALAMVAAMSVSCKNNNKKAKEVAKATEEVVEAAKTILADDVLATLDKLAESFKNEENIVDVPAIISSSLTEQEKLVKPDYLLDPAQASEMVTKSQKINALAVLNTERPIRKAFGMPVDKVDEVIARLAADINFNISLKEDQDNRPLSERYSNFYNSCVENGDVASFWQCAFAIQNELGYLISNNPEVFFRNITEEQYTAFHNRFHTAIKAVETLAEYDADVKAAWDAFNAAKAFDNSGETDKMHATIETAKVDLPARKEAYAARRAALLK